MKVKKNVLKNKNCRKSPNANHVIFNVNFKHFPAELERVGFWMKLGKVALKEGNFLVLGKVFHKFKPNGISGIWLLSESHMSFHTWPDENYLSFDLFTCGDWNRTKNTLKIMEGEMRKQGGKINEKRRIKRGFVYSNCK